MVRVFLLLSSQIDLLHHIQKTKRSTSPSMSMLAFSLNNIWSPDISDFVANAVGKCYRVFFLTGTPPKSSKYKKVNLG